MHNSPTPSPLRVACASPSYPDLAGKGAYSPQERYTVGDVAEVVEFARQRGVRVMVEVDTPGARQLIELGEVGGIGGADIRGV